MIEKIKDGVFIKKGKFGYRLVYPIKKELDKPLSFSNINWRNFILGDLSSLLRWLIIILIVIGFSYAYSHDTALCRETLSNLNQTCYDYYQNLNSLNYLTNTSLPVLNLTFYQNAT